MKEKIPSFQRAMLFFAAGTELAASTIAGAFLGKYLDSKFGTQGILMGVLTMLGFLAGTYNLIIILRKGKKIDGKH